MSTQPSTRLLAQFDSEDSVLAATRAVRERGFTIEDVYAPYAIHGIDDAMGLQPSRLTWVTFLAGLTGLVSMLSFEVWTSAVSWPLNVGGKPFASVPAFIPVAFEFTVLSAGLCTVAALLLRAKLWPGRAPPVLPRVTSDRFALVTLLPAPDREPELRALLAPHTPLEISLDAPAPKAVTP
ncbi:MAG: DUF3341 domain-containing protein [Deltaproteobacteria bacterium]|nr:DUF3341 domain-containing protein [Deltaproteobacteria bacterium]